MERPKYIVAIGASAGGLEALAAFFEHTPLDSVAYVIIPHLSADFKSRMVEILSRHSALEVLEAKENVEVEVNKVYLIPNTKYMGIQDGRLYLDDKEGHTLPHMTIDVFFKSLALDRGEEAIAVVLSGVGSDGSLGAMEIERAGGVVMIQDPNDAKLDGMPVSALNATETPYVFSSKELPGAIQRYVAERDEHEKGGRFTLQADEIDTFVTLIKEHFPFDFSNYKNGTLERRIRRRMAHHNILEVKSFHSFLQANPQEIEMLISDFLIGVTSFFRDPEAYDILEKEVIPKIISSKIKGETLKIWVTCCATGEEAYSLAILVSEYLTHNNIDLDVKIFATDINEDALKQASKGIFSSNILGSVSQERLEKFFDPVAAGFKVKPLIREMLIFARHDLTRNPPYCYVDLISCRNMLIYIKPVLQKQILSKLSFGLKRDGYLFLGSSESISIAKDTFVEVSSKWKIYQSIKSDRNLSFEGHLAAPITGLPLHYGLREPTQKAPPKAAVHLPDITEVILSESGFSGVVIDEQGKVNHSFGDLGPYLKQERLKFTLQELLPDNLGLAFSATLQKVTKSNQRERINNVAFIDPATNLDSLADLIISPYVDRKSGIRGMLVLFKKSAAEPTAVRASDFKIDVQTQEYIAQLEGDLMQAKEDLVSSNEFLETSREAMQSFNEELLSANEEMQSANEELHSINEELETVNNAHKYTINELTSLNDDLNNYFSSNLNGQLFVDKDILLKKYSPGAVNHINLRESDIGRPLSNITTNIKFETIVEDVKNVIQSGEVVIKEIESNEGKLYQVMTSPYIRKGVEEPHGAIITFYDVTDLKKAQKDLDQRTAMLSMATTASGIATWSLDIATRELFCSPRLNEIFGFDPNITVSLQRAMAQIEPSHQANFLRSLEISIINDAKFDIEFPIIRYSDQAHCWVRALGSLSGQDGKMDVCLTGIMQDITDHKLDDLRKNDFIAIVSHELKSPLTSIQGYLQLIEKKASKERDEFLKHSLSKAIAQTRKMEALVSGFLNVSRLQAGKIYLNQRSFKIDDLVTSIVGECLTAHPKRDFKVKAESDIVVMADEDKITQVLENLLSNAVKYSGEGVISVSCIQDENFVQISVQDQGMGIAAEELEKLFDRYYRVNSSSTKNISGFGIGLYLCAEIITRHGGKIWAESIQGEGSVFYFTVPITH